MKGGIESGQLCMVAPIGPDVLAVGNIVLQGIRLCCMGAGRQRSHSALVWPWLLTGGPMFYVVVAAEKLVIRSPDALRKTVNRGGSGKRDAIHRDQQDALRSARRDAPAPRGFSACQPERSPHRQPTFRPRPHPAWRGGGCAEVRPAPWRSARA